METISDYQALSFLVIEDDDMEFTLLQHALKLGWQNTYSLIHVKSAEEAIEYLQKVKFHVIFLDLNILDSRGISTVQKINLENHHKAAIIVTTTMSDKKIALEAIRLGAQDYLVKGEYSPSDLARVLLYSLARNERKSDSLSAKDIVELDSLKIDLIRQKLIFNDKASSWEQDLTPGDIKLLSYFIKNFNQDISRENIAEHVLGQSVQVSERTVDNQVSRLRTKLEKTHFQILSIRGVGYSMTKK